VSSTLVRPTTPAGRRGQDGDLEEVNWEPFFNTFEDRKLAFVYQEKTSDGSVSRFSKFVDRESVELRASTRPGPHLEPVS
jgi:hypothetical protein